MNPNIETCKFQVWSAKRPTADIVTRLAITPLRAAVETDSSVTAIVATDGKMHHWIVPAESLPAFLKHHATVPIVFENAGADFWVIHRHLREYDTVAARAWRKRIDTGKFSSVLLLDQLVRLASAEHDGDEAIPPRTLDKITDELDLEIDPAELPSKSKLRELGSTPHLQCATEKVVLLIRTYQRLRRQARAAAEAVITQKIVIPNVIKKYGWLTEHLQTASEISLARMARRGIRVDQHRFRALYDELRAEQLRLAEQLSLLAPGLLRKSEDKFLTTASGRISRSDTALDKYLREAFETFSRNRPDATLPRTSKGNLARSPGKWQSIAAENAFLQVWTRFERVQVDLQFVRQLDGERLRPDITTLLRTGRTSCANPPLQSLPRTGGIRELIVPRPGYAFLIADIQCFELAALGAICRHLFGESTLADILEAGNDPHMWTAAVLNGKSYEQLRTMKREHPKRFQQLREQAKPINFGVPGGMSSAALVDYAKEAYGTNLSLQKAETFRTDLITKTYPELQKFLQVTSETSVTLTGRIRGGVSCTQFRNTQFQGLAADAAKRALIRLVAANHRVVMFVHDEFLIEIPADGTNVDSEKVRSIVQIIRDATAEVLGFAVKCTFAVADRWSKDVKHLPRIGDQTRVWTPGST